MALDRDEYAQTDGWLARVAEVEAVIPEPHIQLAAAGPTALRLADAGDPVGAVSGLQLTTARLAGSTPPALTDRLLQLEADLLRRVGNVARASDVLAGLRGPATASSARTAARLHLATGDLAAAEEVLAQFRDDDATVRGRVEGAIVRSLIAATQDHAVALSQLEDALLAAAPLGMRRPFLVEAAELRDLLGARIEAGTTAATFAADLIQRMSRPGSPPSAIQVVALTERERHVLRYLASTLSNPEIAAELYLSVNTVKTHQRMIYRKLGADGRRDAVRRAVHSRR